MSNNNPNNPLTKSKALEEDNNDDNNQQSKTMSENNSESLPNISNNPPPKSTGLAEDNSDDQNQQSKKSNEDKSYKNSRVLSDDSNKNSLTNSKIDNLTKDLNFKTTDSVIPNISNNDDKNEKKEKEKEKRKYNKKMKKIQFLEDLEEVEEIPLDNKEKTNIENDKDNFLSLLNKPIEEVYKDLDDKKIDIGIDKNKEKNIYRIDIKELEDDIEEKENIIIDENEREKINKENNTLNEDVSPNSFNNQIYHIEYHGKNVEDNGGKIAENKLDV